MLKKSDSGQNPAGIDRFDGNRNGVRDNIPA